MHGKIPTLKISLIQIFRAGHMPVERPVGRTGRVKRGRAGREGHLREPSVEAVELLGQSNLPMPPGCMIDHGAYGLCLMRGALPPPRAAPISAESQTRGARGAARWKLN